MYLIYCYPTSKVHFLHPMFPDLVHMSHSQLKDWVFQLQNYFHHIWLSVLRKRQWGWHVLARACMTACGHACGLMIIKIKKWSGQQTLEAESLCSTILDFQWNPPPEKHTISQTSVTFSLPDEDYPANEKEYIVKLNTHVIMLSCVCNLLIITFYNQIQKVCTETFVTFYKLLIIISSLS